MIFAVIDRYLTDNVKPNSLTIVEKYPFTDVEEARYFVQNLKKIDHRVISANLEFETVD